MTYMIWKIIWIRRRRKQLGAIPGHPENHWIWGLSHKIQSLEAAKHIFLKYVERDKPKWFLSWLLLIEPSVFPVSPEVWREVLSANGLPKRHGWSGPYRMLAAWIGDGLLVSNGKKWERNRHLLTPAFHFGILKQYVSTFNKVAEIFMEKIDELSADGRSVDVYPMVSRATLDTMLRCVMSYNDNAVQNTGKQHPYVAATHRLGKLFTDRVVNPLCFFDCIYNLTAEGKEFKRLCHEVQEFSEKVIERRKTTMDEDSSLTDKRHLDFIDILLTAKDENGEGLTYNEIRDEVNNVMFAGHDTTAVVTGWVLWSLAKYPEMQNKVRAEVEGILGGRTEPNSEDMTKFQYTVCFIKEVMRWYTPVPAASRIVERPLTVEGVHFTRGRIFDLHYYLVHHNPAVWDNHWEFRPERFLPENSVNRDPFAFIPFSAGQRNCIGQHFAMNEIKTFITRIVTRYTLRADPEREATPVAEIVTRAKDGIHIFFDKRE